MAQHDYFGPKALDSQGILDVNDLSAAGLQGEGSRRSSIVGVRNATRSLKPHTPYFLFWGYVGF